MSKLTGYEQNIKDDEVFSVQANLTNSCTSRCQSCRKYDWSKESLDVNALTEFLHELSTVGLQTVVLSGGEPLMYKDLDNLIDWLLQKNLLYSMITTLAIPFSPIISKVAKTAERLHVSIDAVDKINYQKIRGCDFFDEVMQNLQFVQSVRLARGKNPVRVSTTVSKLNYKLLYDIYDKVVNELDCDLNFYFVHTWDDLLIDDDCKDELIHLLTKIMNDDKGNKTNAEYMILQLLKGNTTNFTKTKVCYLPKHTATIDANGDIYHCCKMLNDNGEYGEQTKFAFLSIYNYESLDKMLSKMKPIETCANEVCQECAQRYDGLLDELTIIHNDIKKPIFL